MDDKLKDSLKSIEEIRIGNTRNICAAVGSQAKLAQILGWERQNLWRLIASNPGRTFTNKTARHIEIIFNLPKHWMDHCNTMSIDQLKNYLEVRQKTKAFSAELLPKNKPEHEVGFSEDLNSSLEVDYIPYYDLESSSQQGKLVIDAEDRMVISLDFMKKMNLNNKQVCAIKINNTLMEPSLRLNSHVVIDHAYKAFESGKIYLIRLKNKFMLRRVYEELDNRVRIAIENKDNPSLIAENPDIYLTPEQAKDMLVIEGKAVWSSMAI